MNRVFGDQTSGHSEPLGKLNYYKWRIHNPSRKVNPATCAMVLAPKDVPLNKNVQALQSVPSWVRWSLLLNGVALTCLLQVPIRSGIPSTRSLSPPPSTFHGCHAPLPSFLATNAPSGTEAPLRQAFRQLDSSLQRYFHRGGIDGLSVAVVASEGSLYEGFWGTQRANESDVGQNTTVNRHSIYRIASISKLFTALETLILRDRGVLKL